MLTRLSRAAWLQPALHSSARWSRNMTSKVLLRPRVAVLYQALEPPTINGIKKPAKPGGYQDSGADIAYVLRKSGVDVITADNDAHPINDKGWCFPDTETGILSAIEKGATHLWANTILFSSHPLQTSERICGINGDTLVVGQAPRLVEYYDDKDFVNDLLRKDGRFVLPACNIVRSKEFARSSDCPAFPLVAKPIRGRGSHGVKLCHTYDQLETHLESLLAESSPAMVESFLSGAEGTVTVMPPSKNQPSYRALPIVLRFNHDDGVAPYNGVVAVTLNSRVPSQAEIDQNEQYSTICKDCELVAEKLKVTAPIRIDVRQLTKDASSRFAIFDVNMKPNMTGPGRPGREDQASLTAIAAQQGLGWDYTRLLQEILMTAQPLHTLRSRTIDTT